jgi:hypothetical protein
MVAREQPSYALRHDTNTRLLIVIIELGIGNGVL